MAFKLIQLNRYVHFFSHYIGPRNMMCRGSHPFASNIQIYILIHWIMWRTMTTSDRILVPHICDQEVNGSIERVFYCSSHELLDIYSFYTGFIEKYAAVENVSSQIKCIIQECSIALKEARDVRLVVIQISYIYSVHYTQKRGHAY